MTTFSEEWRAWKASTDGLACCDLHTLTNGPYLENRLWRAFAAGWNAAQSEDVTVSYRCAEHAGPGLPLACQICSAPATHRMLGFAHVATEPTEKP
jgi:hypothetical protein